MIFKTVKKITKDDSQVRITIPSEAWTAWNLTSGDQMFVSWDALPNHPTLYIHPDQFIGAIPMRSIKAQKPAGNQSAFVNLPEAFRWLLNGKFIRATTVIADRTITVEEDVEVQSENLHHKN